jgi:hypothetical protein
LLPQAVLLGAPGAPHHPALDPRRRRERFGRRKTVKTSGSPADPRVKARRDRSMPRKRGRSEDVEDRAPQDPRARARATLHEASSPGMQAVIPATPSSGGGAVIGRRTCGRLSLPHGGRAGMSGLKGTHGPPPARAPRRASREGGRADGARALRSRSPGRRRGSAAPPRSEGQPRAGRSGSPRRRESACSRRQGGGRAGVCGLRAGRYA